MRRFLAIAAVLLCLALTACGSKADPEHEYILSLLEKKDYDMAILVIEGIREREQGPSPAPVEETAAAEEASIPPSASADTALSGPSAMVYEAVTRFMAEKDAALAVSNPLTVTHALEYRLGNYDGNGSTAHGILVNIQSMVFYDNGIHDQIQLAMDLNTGKIYNSLQVDQSLLGRDPANADAFYANVVNSYFSNLQNGDTILWADSEIQEPLHQNDLETINRKLSNS